MSATSKSASTRSSFRRSSSFLKASSNNYLLDMRMTCDKFGAPLQACCDAATHGKIFSVLPQLTGLHDVLHKDIESLTGGSSKREAAQAAERIMAAFLKLLPFFRCTRRTAPRTPPCQSI